MDWHRKVNPVTTDDLQIRGTQNLKIAERFRLGRVLENVLVDVLVFVWGVSGNSPCFTKKRPKGETA